MLVAFLFFIHVLGAKDTLILGAGPVGLWTALKILQSDPNVQVVVAEKRQEYLRRDHIIITHPYLMPELCEGPLKCVDAKTTIGNYNPDLDDFKVNTVSVKDLQMSILERLDRYSTRFQLVSLKSLSGSPELVEISLDRVPFDKEINPRILIDATGSKAHLMNGILKVPYTPDHHYTHGSVLHFVWPSKLTHPKSKSGRTSSSTSFDALFADPFDKSADLFSKWGYKVDLEAKPFPGANYHGERLNAVFQLLFDPNVDKNIKTQIESIFVDIQRGGKNGITGESMYTRLLAIYRPLETSNPAHTVLQRLAFRILKIGGLGANRVKLRQLRVTFLPERVEKYLSKIKVDRIPVNINIAGRIRNVKVSVMALGDSLAISDFSWGIGTNRGFAMANRIFSDGEWPNKVYQEMVKDTFKTLGTFHDRHGAAIAWLLKAVRQI